MALLLRPVRVRRRIRRRACRGAVLGKTGVEVTILNLGTWRSPGLNRLLRFAYNSGIRYFDTADCYGSEPAIARWFQENPEVRKQIFLVTKDHPNTPKQLIEQLDTRLAALQVDQVDLFLIHGIGRDYGNASLEWPKSKELKETIEAIKKSGKARFVGFSCHDPRRAEYLQAAAEGGFVDAIMLQYTPWLDKDAPLNRALDACHKRGIGLISMKQVAGQSDRILQEVPKRAPELVAKGLTPYQALLHAIWTDERISSSCVSMRNLDQIREDTQAAAKFAPLKIGRDRTPSRRLPGRGANLLRRLRRPLRPCRRHVRRPWRPDPTSHLSRAIRLSRRSPTTLRRASRG